MISGNMAGAAYRPRNTGSGIAPRSAPFGHITVSGKSGEIVRIAAADIFPKFAQVFQGIYVQASGGSVKVSTTMATADLGLSPDQDDGDHWVVDTTAAPAAITKLKTPATALKLEFLGDAILYIAGV